MQAAIYVHTFKDGLLSKLAHDLLLRPEQVALEVQGNRVEVRCDTAQWEVLGTMQAGKLVQPGPSASDQQKILQNLCRDVLQSERHPTARYTGTATPDGKGGLHVAGHLTLCGVSLPLSFSLTRVDGLLRGGFEFVPSRFGIKPFRALGGALKVQDRVRIEIEARE